ncbi:hypothetical protein TeGR_g6486 [Tetraparma gracilis]|uniref:Uncharacterized protein n=1 Tax=Tetraparma gracilis TaxID=2962635 RepID=A0ABQ6N7H4_9STRA|nr:hypothetical protein TeGR_g6486 [Tetraparma gracilis]
MTLPSTRTLLLSSVTVASLYVVHSRIIASFGSYGRLGMFVWEGDSLTAEERAASDALNEAEKKLKELAKTLGDVEVEMEVAKMDGLDGGEARGIVVSPFNASIVKRLAEVSDLLDKTAAKLDTVATEDDAYRRRRKRLAQDANGLMARADEAIDVVSRAKRLERDTKDRAREQASS